MRSLQVVILAPFLQVMLQIQGLIMQGFDIGKFDLLSKALMPPLEEVWFGFERMHHTIVLHQYQISCVYDIIRTKELCNWVKT